MAVCLAKDAEAGRRAVKKCHRFNGLRNDCTASSNACRFSRANASLDGVKIKSYQKYKQLRSRWQWSDGKAVCLRHSAAMCLCASVFASRIPCK